MAGYSGFSKSNNAIEAERHGKMTATALAKSIGRGATAAGVRAVISPVEWHHTSKMYNRTDYFSLESAAERLADREDISVEAAEIGVIEKIIAASKTDRVDSTFLNCRVEWVEWSGTRHHPHAKERSADGCEVTRRNGGSMVDVIMPDGTKLRKKIGANGFYVYANNQRIF